MIYKLNGETYLELDRETMVCMVSAIRLFMRLDLSDKMRAELGNVCAVLGCQIQRLPASDPNMDLLG